MLIKFEGENAGSLIMFGSVAEQLLRMMGMSGNRQGAIRAGEVGEALNRLKAALAAQDGAAADDGQQGGGDDDSADEVSLATRAVPLIQLLETELAQGGAVMWRPED